MLRAVALALLGLAAVGEPLALLCTWECSSMQHDAPASARFQMPGEVDCTQGCLLRKQTERQASVQRGTEFRSADLLPSLTVDRLPVANKDFWARWGPEKLLLFPSLKLSSVVLRV